MQPVDLLVVGAGPAGAAAALAARAAGLDVVVADKATFARDKTCGDGLTTGALRLLERLGVDVPALASAAVVREVVIVSPSGRHVELPLPADGQHAAVVTRLDLDAAMVERVRAAGVEVREGAALHGLELEGAGAAARVRASFDGDGRDDVEARYVVAADGHYSTVRRILHPDAPPDLGTWHAARQYFEGVDDRRLWVLFERDLLPGYAWVFPLAGGRANVGFGVLRDRSIAGKVLDGKALHALWRNVLACPSLRAVLGPDARPVGTSRAWPIPTAYSRDSLADLGGRVLYVGDAARVVDSMTGEGIAQALETGMLAAESIARGGTAAVVGWDYRQAVDRALGRDLRFAALLQRVLANPLGARAAIRAAGLSPWTRRNFARWMFEDYPRALLFTPDRWHRHAFTGPGAFRAANGDAAARVGA